VGFDITRAISESFGSRSPLLDRVLSYLYFADVTVIEQSTWDDYGSGVSILGLKGDRPGPGGIVLGCPLPTVGHMERDPAIVTASGGHPLDLARFVDIMAKIWAMSELDGPSLPWSVNLVAYRPDPVSFSLRSVIEDGLVTGARAYVFSPTGPVPRSAACGFALCSLTLSGPTRQRPGGPVQDVASVRITDGDLLLADNGFPVKALAQLLAMSREGRVELLDLSPAAGSDLAAPGHIDVDLGLLTRQSDLPRGWVIRDPARTSVRLGTWSTILPAVVEVTDRLAATVRDLWTDQGLTHPATPVRILSIDSSPQEATLLVGVPLPLGPASCSDALNGAINPEGPLEGARVRGHILTLSSPGESRADDEAADSSTCLSGAIPWVASTIPGCREMGPLPDETAADPEGTALTLAQAYLTIIQQHLDGD